MKDRDSSRRSIRATVCFAAASALSLLGNSVAGVVLPLVLLATTGDVLAAGSLAVICALPQVVCGVLGGAVLDRCNRRTVSIASDVVSALCVAALPLVDMTVGLSFGWFVLFGVLGAVGDIPGMTARDTLVPAVTAHDGVSLERYLGISGTLESLVTIVGPAAAAGFMALGGGVTALWATAALSLMATALTCTLPRCVGVPGNAMPEEPCVPLREQTTWGAGAGEVFAASDAALQEVENPTGGLRGFMASGLNSVRAGIAILFAGDAVVRSTVLLNLGVVGVMAGFQGIVLPAYFTEIGEAATLGMVLSFLSAGMLAGSVIYSAWAPRLRRRWWYALSLVGMLVGVAVMGALASVPSLMAGSFMCGLFAGPISALLGFLMLDRIPDVRRGAALGTQNTLMLVVGPVSVFVSSALVYGLGVRGASWILVGAWGLVTLAALAMRSMRTIDEDPRKNPTSTPSNRM